MSTIFRSNRHPQWRGASAADSALQSQAMNVLLWTDTQKRRHLEPRATAGTLGPGVCFSLSLPNYLLTLEDGLAKRRWVNTCCHSKHFPNEHDIIPYHGRWDPEGKNKLTTSTHAKDLIHPCFTPASVPLRSSQKLCELDLWFLSGIWLAGYF